MQLDLLSLISEIYLRSDDKRKEKLLKADWQYSRQPTRDGPGPVNLLSLSAGPLAAQA